MWRKLLAISEAQKRSVGDLIRVAVKKVYYADRDLGKLVKAVSEIRRIRKYVGKVDYKELINFGRKY